MDWIKLISGPAVGAVIGYFTNYLAIKMLFRPHKPIMIGKWKVPFTPGIIPSRKGDLARAIGGAIESSLFSRDDIRELLCGEDMQNALAEGIWTQLERVITSDHSLRTELDTMLGEGIGEEYREKAAVKLSKAAADKLNEVDIGATIASVAGKAVEKKLKNTLFGNFITADMVAGFVRPTADTINDYIRTDGASMLENFIRKETGRILDTPVNELIHLHEDTQTRICDKIKRVYTNYMNENAQTLVQSFEIGRVVEDKINAMDVSEFEALVMNVMKNELSAIVNLGAVLGLIIGIVNSFI